MAESLEDKRVRPSEATPTGEAPRCPLSLPGRDLATRTGFSSLAMPGSAYTGDGSLVSVPCRSGEQREAVEDLPQMLHLSRDELREREPNDVYSPVDVGDDAQHLGAR